MLGRGFVPLTTFNKARTYWRLDFEACAGAGAGAGAGPGVVSRSDPGAGAGVVEGIAKLYPVYTQFDMPR